MKKLAMKDKAEALGIKRYCGRRAKKAADILTTFYDREDLESSMGDIIADLLHLCAVKNIDWDDRYENGRRHFNAEIMGGEHG